MARRMTEVRSGTELDWGSPRKGLLAPMGAVGAAVLGSLCCVGPLLFVTFGVGAGLASTFEPLRPVFGLLMAGGLGIGFYTVYGGRPKAHETGAGACCVPGNACAAPRRGRRDRVILWSATIVALLVWSFPTWSTLFV